MTPDQIRQELELKIVELLQEKIDAEVMTEERRQQIAKIVLSLLKPGMSLEELYQAIPKLDDQCTELSPVIVPYLREYEQNVAQQAEAKMSTLIKEQKYEEADKLADSVISQKVKLVYYGKGTPPH